MKSSLAIAVLLCSLVQAQPFGSAPRQLTTTVGPPDTVNDGLQPLANIPYTSDEDLRRTAFGVSAGRDGIIPLGDYPTVRNQLVQNYQGIGISTKAGDGRIIDCISRHNYIGARLGSSDSEIRGCRLYNNRDVCLWIAANAGNCQSTQNHCYGARIACYNEGGAMYRAVQDTYADAYIGHLGDTIGGGSSQETLTNILFQHNTVADCIFRGFGCHLVNCIVNVQRDVKKLSAVNIPKIINRIGKIGIELGERCTIRGGTVALQDWKHPANEYSGLPATAIVVRGNDCVINTLLVDDDKIDGSLAIQVLGPRRGLQIDCIVAGFQGPNERLLIVDDAAHANGLDITFRINGLVKPIGGYIKIGAGWTGSVKLFDTASGKTIALPEGQGY